MSYCIMNVIYGVPLTEEVIRQIKEIDERVAVENGLELAEVESEPEDFGFECFYTGGPQLAGFCGVQLGEVDECTDYIAFDYEKLTLKQNNLMGAITVKLSPTAKQQRDAEKKVNALPKEIRKLCPKIGVYLIPSSS